MRGINEDNYITCEVIDGHFAYVGWCFPTKNHLYFILEKDRLFNEIIVYATNLPDRYPPKLFGIILCLSGGIDETHSFPSAAKVAFKYIGKTEEDVRNSRHIDASEKHIEQFLRRTVPGYIQPDDNVDPELKSVITEISNEIGAFTLPFALRMEK